MTTSAEHQKNQRLLQQLCISGCKSTLPTIWSIPLLAALASGCLPIEGSRSLAAASAVDKVTQPDAKDSFSLPGERSKMSAPRAEFAVEKALGARCPEDQESRLLSSGNVLDGACHGRMPSQLAKLLVDIPSSEINISRTLREQYVQREQLFKAVPGHGQRSDFIVSVNESHIWIRSFEGSNPATTIYLIEGPFDCMDADDTEPGGAEALEIEGVDCEQVHLGKRIYRTIGGNPPEDVTARFLPAQPGLTEEEQQRYGRHQGYMGLDVGRLQQVPTMRWFMRFPSIKRIPDSDPRRYSSWSLAHFGFVVWNGENFELRQHVARSLWPCKPVRPNQPACSEYPDAGFDPFVMENESIDQPKEKS